MNIKNIFLRNKKFKEATFAILEFVMPDEMIVSMHILKLTVVSFNPFLLKLLSKEMMQVKP